MKPVAPTPRALAWILGILEVLLSMAAAVWLLTSPALFRWYYPALGLSSYTGDAQAIVDWLSSSHRERSLNLALRHGKLTQKELNHYSDVRQVFRRLPMLTCGLALITLLWLLALRPSVLVITAAQTRGLLFWLVLLLFGAGLALWDWKTLFAWLHNPFFGEHSWRLPKDCYSLQLFPAAFWQTLAAIVLLAPAALLGCIALQVKLWAHQRQVRSAGLIT